MGLRKSFSPPEEQFLRVERAIPLGILANKARVLRVGPRRPQPGLLYSYLLVRIERWKRRNLLNSKFLQPLGGTP